MRTTVLATLICTCALAAAFPATSTTPLPLIIWHGLGDNYASDGLREVGELAEKINPGTFVYNIRLDNDAGSDRTATFFGNVTTQLQQVCDDLATHPILSTAPAVNALGFSQGGQFLRGYIERCNYPKVRNLVTFGSQHNGIARFQTCGPTDWLCKAAIGLLRSNTWSSFVQNRVVPAQYYRSVNETTGLASDEYLEYSNFLADINNERELKNRTYAERLAGLENFVMFIFAEDKTVIPKETSWFAEVNETSNEVTHLRDRPIYKEDWLGLKKLDEKGGLVFKNITGGHMNIDEEVLSETFQEYFSPVKRSKAEEQQVFRDFEL